MTQCLIIDGDPSGRQRLEAMLSRYGFDLAVAESEEAAIAQCRRTMPALIVLDEGSGCTDAGAFIRRLRRITGRPPKIIVSPRSREPRDIGRAIWDGVAECLMKPYDEDILDLKLRQTGVV
jgi:two-component system chemotaxis response regulator CheY